jgi:hypothetical protein
MIIKQRKHSFLFIEILLGFFLLAIFILLFQSVPKSIIHPMMEKTIKLELSHLAKRDYIEIANSIDRQELHSKKGACFFHPLEDEKIIIPHFFNGYVKKNCELTLKEIKTSKEEKIFLYQVILSYRVGVLNKEVNESFTYHLLSKSRL